MTYQLKELSAQWNTKPASATPVPAIPLAGCAEKAGLSHGVFQVEELGLVPSFTAQRSATSYSGLQEKRLCRFPDKSVVGERTATDT